MSQRCRTRTRIGESDRLTLFPTGLGNTSNSSSSQHFSEIRILDDVPSLPHQDVNGFRDLMLMGADLIGKPSGKISVSTMVRPSLMIVKIKFIP